MTQPRKNPRKNTATGNRAGAGGKSNLSRDEARSISKKKQERKRQIKKRLGLALLAFVVICVSVILALTVLFKINTIAFKGEKVYSNAQLIEASGVEIGDSLFSVNEEKLSDLLSKKLPYIKSATVSRKLPDTLVIELKAARECAAFTYGEGYILVDDEGKILDNNATMLRENVAVVSGVSPKSATEGELVSLGNKDITSDFITIISALRENEFNGVTEIRFEKNEFKVVYQDRIIIKMGAMENLEVKLQRAKAAIDKENQMNPYVEGVLDLGTEPNAYFKAGEEEDVTISPEYVTDAEGNVVTDKNGAFLTTAPNTTSSAETKASEE